MVTAIDKKCHPPVLFPFNGPDMPVAMNIYIQSKEINDTAYVGGGATYRDEDAYVMMAYNTQSCQWHTLPRYSTWGFAMTIRKKQISL